jgi:GR25 family glycosyltransferase involved in LPS biosynthesis
MRSNVQMPQRRSGLGAARPRPVGFHKRDIKKSHSRVRRHRSPLTVASKHRQTRLRRVNWRVNRRVNRHIEILEKSASSTQVPVPPLMKNMFVISIRSDRADRMMRRLGNWRSHANLLWGTRWNTINVNKWIASGKVIKTLRFRGRRKRLTRGELGCYDSHVRVWKDIVKRNIPHALVLEDDAEISLIQAKRMEEISSELENRKDWDVVILYPINHVHRANPFQANTAIKTRFIPIQHMTGLAGYLVSQAGARKLLKKPFPIAGPVDAYVPELSKTGQLKLLLASPALGNQLNRSDSDTKR